MYAHRKSPGRARADAIIASLQIISSTTIMRLLQWKGRIAALPGQGLAPVATQAMLRIHVKKRRSKVLASVQDSSRPPVQVLKQVAKVSAAVGPTPKQKAIGLLLLSGVSLLWAVYAPCLKALLLLKMPPSPQLLNSARGIISCSCVALCCGLATLLSGSSSTDSSARSSQQDSTTKVPEPGAAEQRGEGDAQGPEASSYSSRNSMHTQSPVPEVTAATAPEGPLSPLLMRPPSSVVEGGIELGAWNFAATAVGTIGLDLTTATQAAFITQTATLLVPVLAWWAGTRHPAAVWAACVLGLAGAVMVGLDGALPAAGAEAAAAAAAQPQGTLQGQLLLLAAALGYAVYTIRLGCMAPLAQSEDVSTGSTSSNGEGIGGKEKGKLQSLAASLKQPLLLAALSSATTAVLSTLWLLLSCASQPRLWAQQLQVLSGIHSNGAALGSLVLAGMGPGALATIFQTLGQGFVSPTQAQVIFASSPLWSAVLASAVLGERMGPLAWAGGAAILAASFAVSRAEDTSHASPTPSTAAPSSKASE